MGDYIDTPQTHGASYITNGHDRLSEISPEKSFAAPAGKGDLVSQMRSAKNQGISLKTPRVGARDPLRLLPNGNQVRSEFTPLMKSATKNNIARRLSSKKSGLPTTPAYLKDGQTPALPRSIELSLLASEHASSSLGIDMDNTPMPQHISSSAQSTPLAQLPGRGAGGLISDGNMMTLREQENIIDKIEKENFGLKMKIHFLEDALSKRGNEFNQAALKENTDLKVNRITMQRELHKFKKNIAQAERDAEIYRLQLEEFKERIRRKQVDESMRSELETLRSQVQAKEEQIQLLEDEKDLLKSDERSGIQRLKDEIEDLQAELREKDRTIDERDDQLDEMKMKASQESRDAAGIEDELESAKEQIEDLKQSLERAMAQVEEAKEGKQDALDEKKQAEEDLDELRDEMANKSFTTKGLSRQLEEKANKLEDEMQIMQDRYEALRAESEQKNESERQSRERMREMERDSTSDLRKVHQDLELCQQQRDTFERKLNAVTKQLESMERDFQIKSDEKILLQTRHDALTTESAGLQMDLTNAQKSIESLERDLDSERKRSAQHDSSLRAQHQQEVELLNEQLDSLHREVSSKQRNHDADVEEWDAQRRTLEVTSQKAEERATGLQRTVDKMQQVQGSINGRELKLQEALDSEKQRHEQEEEILVRQVKELQDTLASKRASADESKIELNNAQEELRISIREQAALKEKVAELEEEIEVLQSDIEQEHDFAETQRRKHSTDADIRLQRIQQENQSLQEAMTKARVEMKNAKSELATAAQERAALEARLQHAQKPSDDTFNMDQEKRELKRTKLKLEKEVARLTTERDSLAKANETLEDEINAELERSSKEENRLSAELDMLKKESFSAKQDADLRQANRNLKIRINDLEQELHEAKLAQYKTKSPSVSPPPSHSKELARLREDLLEAQAQLKVIGSENRDLKRAVRRTPVDEAELAKVQTLLRNRTAEAEALNAKIAEQDGLVEDLREELDIARADKESKLQTASEVQRRTAQIADLKAEIKYLREEKGKVNRPAAQMSGHDDDAREMKHQLRQLREQRSVANKKAEAVESELEALQRKYESMLEKLTSGKSSKDEVRAKEMRGLIKEIMWLKARCKREERLRKDLAWSKGFLEQGEAMRVQYNRIDLDILGEMGVSLDGRRYEARLKPVQKFRAGVFMVIAAIRMRNMEEQWRDARLMGQKLELIRSQRVKPRSRFRVLEV